MGIVLLVFVLPCVVLFCSSFKMLNILFPPLPGLLNSVEIYTDKLYVINSYLPAFKSLSLPEPFHS